MWEALPRLPFIMDGGTKEMLGFTYNGIHSESLGVYYVPDATARGDYFTDYSVIDSERSWFDGGDYFKTRLKTKVFKLDCFYDRIDYATREKIIRWLDRRTSGTLVFDERPYAEYFVHPTVAPEPKDYLQGDKYSGTFTLTLSAYNPFAKLTCLNIESDTTGKAILETGIIAQDKMPAPVATSSVDFFIYNPGTEVGHSYIKFAGATGSSDLIIRNAATNDVFVLKHGLTTGANEYYEAYSKTGRVTKTNQSGTVVDFAFHDLGYITFEPNMPIIRDAVVHTTSGSRTITSSGLFTNDMVGKYIFIDGQWKYIGTVTNANTATVNTNNLTTGNVITDISNINYLTISKANDAVINTIEVVCIPEVR